MNNLKTELEKRILDVGDDLANMRAALDAQIGREDFGLIHDVGFAKGYIHALEWVKEKLNESTNKS